MTDKLVWKSKGSSIIKENEVSLETLKNSIKDLDSIFYKLRKIKNKIEKCNSIEDLEKNINLADVSNELGIIIQNYVFIDDIIFKKRIEEVNHQYRDTEILYFNKKFDLVNKKMEETFKNAEDNINDVTGGTLFSFLSVFLGISLTTSLVSGVQYAHDYIILYFLTCLLIAVVIIGISAIFMRRFDKKSLVIFLIILMVSTLWLFVFFDYKEVIINKI